MQIEVYRMTAEEDTLTITLEAVCDTFSSLLWDIEYYKCGSFEVYIAANPQNIEIFQTGRIVGRDDDNQHFGIIESVLINTDIENGDYLTVRGRFLMCLLERRIIHPTYNVTAAKAYSEIVREVVTQNALLTDNRRIPGLSLGTVTGTCWEQYRMVFDLSEGADRSIMQADNPHIIFSDAYSNLLSFSYAEDSSVQKNFAYIFGQGKGDERKRTTYCDGDEPTYLDRYELYVDADDISETEQVEGETIPIPEEKYIELLKTRGSERLVLPKTASESEIAAHNTQYVYNRDYFVGDYVTVQHRRFGMMQPQIQLIGMIEGFDQNGRSLTPTFQEV